MTGVETLEKKLERIERLLVEINSKIDNFMGYEYLSKKEREELRKMREEIRKGEFIKFEDLFGELWFKGHPPKFSTTERQF